MASAKPSHPPKQLKLWYWAVPGRAEAIRLAAYLGGITLEERIITFEEWPKVKTETPFGKIPVLEVDGHRVTESSAILLYIADLAGLKPDTAFDRLRANEALFWTYHWWESQIVASYLIQDPEAKLKHQAELAAGPLKDKLRELQALVVQGEGGYIAGGKLSFADLAVFARLSALRSGAQIQGVPKTFLDEFPALKTYRNKIAALPKIREFFKDKFQGIYAGFHTDEEIDKAS